MTDDVPQPTPFKATNYDYEVQLGTVMDRDTISWTASYRCQTWPEVERLVATWSEYRDHPAVEVEVDYIPHRLPSETKTGQP